MNKLSRIFQYTLYDLIRSKWSIFYFIFFALSGFVLFSFNKDSTKAIVSLLSIVLIIIPLICMILGSLYFYNVREFIDLLLSQPIQRKTVFLGLYLGLTTSLSLGFILGVVLSMIISGVHAPDNIPVLLLLLAIGIILTFIFTALSLWISLSCQNKIKGVAISIFLWLFMAILYDGIFLLWIIMLREYPTERHAIVLTLLNPIDLSRILIMLRLDSSALMGYTGAVLQKFFGTSGGMLVVGNALLIWTGIPILGMLRSGSKKDF
jgi:Cu-processing system permease protein